MKIACVWMCMSLGAWAQNDQPAAQPVIPPAEAGVYDAWDKRITAPVVTERVQPALSAHHVQGRPSGPVVLAVVFRKNGTITDLKFLRAGDDDNEALGKAVKKALRGWRYTPGTLEGRPVDVRMILKIDISLL